MADEPRAPQRTTSSSELESAKIHLTNDNHLRVEFSIKELIRRLAPGGALMSNCGGCRGCMGCSM